MSVKYHVDAVWCDTRGVYARGWAYDPTSKTCQVHLRSGDHKSGAGQVVFRPDVKAAFQDVDDDQSGFACYLSCEPFRPVFLTFETSLGTTEFPLEAGSSDEPHGLWEHTDPMDEFVRRAKTIGGKVLEIGARVVSPAGRLQAARFAPECEFIGADIHAAVGVDVVVDAHSLTSKIEPGSLSSIFSLAVLEHIAVPWVVAAEINHALRIGGLTYHLTPQSWPLHEKPNDFWRMSDDGLRVLFGEAMGFEVLYAGMANPLSFHTPKAMRMPPYLEFPLEVGMAASFILSRKVRDVPPSAVSWPATRRAMEQQALQYPRHDP